jgi:nicotinate phosphoribosyltransferase
MSTTASSSGDSTNPDALLTVGPPTNTLVSPLLTDLYQITMVYSYWKNNRHNLSSIFELFFRKNPFGGEYTIIAGLDECIKFIHSFQFSVSDIEYLQSLPVLQHCDPGFFDYLIQLNTKENVTIRAIPDGTVVFPRIPLVVVEAPLAIGQLLETTLLTLLNYPSLICTNAARMVLAAAPIHGPSLLSPNASSSSLSELEAHSSMHFAVTSEPALIKPAQCYRVPVCAEFGLRRAQGPDGGFSASKYSAMGGFVSTSNVLAGKLCGLKVSGTHAHSFVQSYSSLDEVKSNKVTTNEASSAENPTAPKVVELLPAVLHYRSTLGSSDSSYLTTNDGELAAFIAYATAFPHSFLCLIDTYDTLKSGLLNYVIVSLVLDDLGYVPAGIRLDSGDLAYLSMECALLFQKFADERPFFHNLNIVASNDINEDVLHALSKQDHAITMYGIGTNLVTCQKQPALGCVYKLVEIAGIPRIKLSQDISKVLIPGQKKVFRFTGKDGKLLLDVMLLHHEPDPVAGARILCRHPFVERKRAAVTPSHVEELHVVIYENGRVISGANRSFEEAKSSVQQQLRTLRSDILRYTNPTPYKVSVSDSLFQFLHTLWQEETPVAELS